MSIINQKNTQKVQSQFIGGVTAVYGGKSLWKTRVLVEEWRRDGHFSGDTLALGCLKAINIQLKLVRVKGKHGWYMYQMK